MERRLLAAVICLAFLACSGCMNLLGGLGTIVPNSGAQAEQVKALQDANMDVYLCFQLGGPPPIGGVTVIGVPRGVKPSINWGGNCQPVVGKVE